MRFRNNRLALALALYVIGCTGFYVTSCASAQVQKARQVDVDVHAVLASIDDAERALYESGTVQAWTQEKHQEFSRHLIVALKAGAALNDGVATVPMAHDAKADLATVSAELETLTGLVAGVLPANSTVSIALTAGKDAVLKLLPLFLQ